MKKNICNNKILFKNFLIDDKNHMFKEGWFEKVKKYVIAPTMIAAWLSIPATFTYNLYKVQTTKYSIEDYEKLRKDFESKYKIKLPKPEEIPEALEEAEVFWENFIAKNQQLQQKTRRSYEYALDVDYELLKITEIDINKLQKFFNYIYNANSDNNLKNDIINNITLDKWQIVDTSEEFKLFIVNLMSKNNDMPKIVIGSNEFKGRSYYNSSIDTIYLDHILHLDALLHEYLHSISLSENALRTFVNDDYYLKNNNIPYTTAEIIEIYNVLSKLYFVNKCLEIFILDDVNYIYNHFNKDKEKSLNYIKNLNENQYNKSLYIIADKLLNNNLLIYDIKIESNKIKSNSMLNFPSGFKLSFKDVEKIMKLVIENKKDPIQFIAEELKENGIIRKMILN